MTPQDLKNSVLQRAIQGKLVPQDPKEGSGEELLRQIREEKTRLLKEGKIKKEKPLPDIDDEEKPFDIPDNWVWVRLGEISDMCLGKMLDKAKNQGVFQPYLRNVNVRWGEFDFNDILEMRFKPEEEERYSIRYADLIVCEGGEPGRCAVWLDSTHSFKIQKALHRIRFYGNVSSLYAYHLFRLFAENSYFAQKCTGTTIKHLTGENLAKVLFPLPPLSEQKRIVSKLESLEPFIESYTNAWTRLEELSTRFPSELRKSLLQRAIEGRLVARDPSEGTGADLLREIQKEKKRLIEEGKIKKEKPLPEITDDEKPFEIPGHWTWVRLGDCCFDLSYGTSRKSVKNGNVAVLRMGNIQNGKIDYSNLVFSENKEDNQKYLLEPYDLLFNRTNSRELVGKTGIYRGERIAIYAGYLVRIRLIMVDSEYANFVMNSEYEHKYCQREKSDGINQSNVNASKIANIPIPLPPLSEQKRIVSKLEELLPLCERLTVARR